VDSSLIEPT